MRISGISFLNAAPLVQPLPAMLPKGVQLRLALPSQCAELLRSGAAEVALIPLAAYATTDDLLMAPGICIGARGPVRSIYLVSKVPIEKIKSVAGDRASRSSVALCRVLFSKFYGGARRFVSMPADLRSMLQAADAALIIGDPAMQLTPARELYVYDLSEEWHRHTGLPFVFAVWAAHQSVAEKVNRHRLVPLLQKARDAGIALIPEIAAAWAPRMDLEPEALQSYLENLHYRLDEDYVKGMQLFLQYAHQAGVLPGPVKLRYLEEGPAAASRRTR